MDFIDSVWDWKTDRLYDMIYFDDKCTLMNYTEFFNLAETKSIIIKISDILFTQAQIYTIYPPMEDVFKAFNITKNPVGIILGMDPYHNKGSATGLCFSLYPNATYINPSLRNIQIEVENNGFNVNKNSGNLSPWAKQDILMLNASLTVEEGDPGVHLKYWCEFTEKFLEYISTKYDDLFYILWGRDAQSFISNIKSNGLIFKSSHPCPMSAYKASLGSPSFFGSRFCNKINEYLVSKNKSSINWIIS